MSKSEYAKSGVDYTIMEPFKMAMVEAGKRTLSFPNKRDVYVREDLTHAHGAVYEYRGTEKHLWCKTQEDLGNKNWIAEWMYAHAGTGRTYYEGIGNDTVLIIANDVIAQGAMPVIFTDQLEVGDDSWYADEKRAKDLAESFYNVCKEIGAALPAGESAALKYLLNPAAPVKACPSLSGSVTGIVAPTTNLVDAQIEVGDHIIAVASTGLHANGVSLVIQEGLKLEDKFLTEMSDGQTFGDHALIPIRSYVALVEALLESGVTLHTFLPATGDGVGKIAFDKREMTYRINSWFDEVPLLFRYFRENLKMPLVDCMKTFNWGAGYYIFAPADQADRIVDIGTKAGYDIMDVGIVEEGKREVIFEPEGVTLPPPGE